MKKHLLLVVLCLYVMPRCLAQSIYYDAKTLTMNCHPALNGKKLGLELTEANGEIITPILFNYLTPENQAKVSDPGTSHDDKLNIYSHVFDGNPFIVMNRTGQEDKTKILSAGSEAAPSGGQSLTTTVIDAVAKFLVKRTKEELTSAFFDDFQATLDKQPDLQFLFPNTYTVLRAAKNEIYTYRVYLPALQQAFLNDVDNFLDNGLTWTKSSVPGSIMEKLQTNHKPVYAGLKSAFFIGRELDQGTHPGAVFNSLVLLSKDGAAPSSDNIDFSVIHRNVPPALKTVNLFSQSLRSGKEGRYWIDGEEFKAFENPHMVVIYFGLLYQKLSNEKVNNPICFVDKNNQEICVIKLMEDLAAAAGDALAAGRTLKSVVEKFKVSFQSIDQDVNAVANQGARKASNYARMIKPLTTLVQTVSDGPLLDKIQPLGNSALVSFYVEHLTALYSDIHAKAYNAAIYEAFTVLDTALADKNNATLKAFLKYGTFIATVSTAENSDEVEAAIEAIVLPPGSASIKRKTKSNIALNAYVGLSPAIEAVNGKGAFTFGVAAPIGVAFSWGGKNHPSSSSVFVSIVDLGAVTSYRFNDQNTAELPELTFSNIFAPGLYYVYGIPKIPVSAGIGGQLGPQLRDIKEGVAVTDNVNFAFKFFLAVDIPLLNFRTKTR